MEWEYQEEFLNVQEAGELFTFCMGLEFRRYPVRGKELKRSPKIEFRKDGALYRWGQEKKSYDWGLPIPSILERLIEKIGNDEINHVIIISYTDGVEHHIPFHSDKAEGVNGAGAKDIVYDSTIYNVCVCDKPRIFQLAKNNNVIDGKAVEYEFNDYMEHGSLFVISGKGNREMKHCVPRMKGWKGNRFSIVLRSVKVVV